MPKKVYYGLASKGNALELSKLVCDVISNPDGLAEKIVNETCAAETKMGTYKDNTDYYAGTGAHQIDKGTFDWLKGKYQDEKVAEKLKAAFDINLSKVEYRELEQSPILSTIFCRLRYLAVPAAIPALISERAQYWKKWYNSSAGKGTPEEYLAKVKECGLYD